MFNIRFKKYPISCVLIAVIWYLSLLFNAPETPLDNVPLVDKWVHMVMYGGTFSVLWIEYIRQHQQPDYKKLLIWAFIAPIVMSGIIELLQEYCTKTRQGEWTDLLANSIGVVLAAVIGLILLHLHARRNRVS
jgi:VanZ family protein